MATLSYESRKLYEKVSKMRNYLMQPKVAEHKRKALEVAQTHIDSLLANKKREAGEEIASKRDELFEEIMATVPPRATREELVAKRDQFETNLEEASKAILERIKEQTQTEIAFVRQKALATWNKVLEDGYGEIKEKYPQMWTALTDDAPGFELSRLREMLAMKDLIGAGSITHEVASEQIGQRYFNEFVKPHVGANDGGTKGGANDGGTKDGANDGEDQ